MRILIADDERNNRLLMHQYLSDWGLCDLVVDGAEALEAFEMAAIEAEPYDLICLDRHMPALNGDDALSAIRELEMGWGIPPRERVVVLLISGEERALRGDPHQEGGTEMILKPVNGEKLHSRLRAWGFHPLRETTPEPSPPDLPLLPRVAGLDLADGLERVVNNTRLYTELIANFLDEHAGDSDTILATLDAQRIDDARRLLHRLKGASGNIGAKRLHQAAKSLEEALRDPHPVPSDPLKAELMAAMEELLPGLRTIRMHNPETTSLPC
ncbi:MAG: Hpt domain-containing protein [Magnetococcales bacterium]|nr:Hpt domain-containing protein [Magnetococcales bacterium]